MIIKNLLRRVPLPRKTAIKVVRLNKMSPKVLSDLNNGKITLVDAVRTTKKE